MSVETLRLVDSPPDGFPVLSWGEPTPAPQAPVAPAGKILLNTGPSPRGAHRLETILTCPQLYAYLHVLKLDLGDRTPLVRGSLGHVSLAHHYVQLRAVQRGEDPAAFYEPHVAIDQAALTFGDMGVSLAPVI